MLYHSLGNPNIQDSLETVILAGLAKDGGLFFPNQIPTFSQHELTALVGLDLPSIASIVLKKWFAEDIEVKELEVIGTSLTFPIPLVQIGDKYVLELFHGPTLAFKDVAATILARLISYFARKKQTIIRVLVATSGDTGGAVAHGFANLENVQVYVLFPKNKVSQLQEKQLTCVAENVCPIEVEGYFDDCQAMVKQAFNDPDLQPLNLTSANSINLGRLIPQIIYHLWVWTQLPESDLQLVIPSGNFGNLAAAFLAMKMGVPISRFVAGVNANDTVYRFMQTGKYEPRPTVSTLSNAMDISNPSNFSRILKIVNYDHSTLQQYLQVFRVTDQETTETILEVYNKYNYLLCPHTAVAWKAANLSEHMGLTQVVYATASPYKFAKEINAAAGLVIDDNQLIQQWSTKSSKKVSIAANYSEFKQVLQASA